VNAQVVSDAVWAALAAAALALAASAHLAHSRVERLSALVHRLGSHRVTDVAVLLGWMWLGWHFFAR
jgi:hypothetical protein